MNKLFAWPLSYLDKTPMYKVVVHALLALYITALGTSMVGLLGYTPLEILATSAVVAMTAGVMSYLCAWATKAPAQHLSSFITALILILLLLPSTLTLDLFGYAAITALAIASKYVIVYKKQHLLNPVAIGLVLGAMLGFGGGAWWVASPVLFVPLVVGGWLVAEKVKRLDMVAVFLGVSFLFHVVSQWSGPTPTTDMLTTFWLSYPYVFLAFFMLTEPFTMPSQRVPRLVYAGVVAAIASLPPIAGFVFSPELVLVMGNIAFAPWSLRQKLQLKLVSVHEVAPGLFEFMFTKPQEFRYEAGQYLEWMLPHASADSRGVRRYFTIASSPEESTLRVVFKIPPQASSFKKQMQQLQPGAIVIASQLAGDFLLPKNPKTKLGFIAGGIGVTPFVSHAETLLLRSEDRDVVSIYCVARASDTAYIDMLHTAGPVVTVVASGEAPQGSESGFLSADIITRRVPDYASRTWYISGPPVMVDSAYAILRELGVRPRNIKRDFFPGLA